MPDISPMFCLMIIVLGTISTCDHVRDIRDSLRVIEHQLEQKAQPK